MKLDLSIIQEHCDPFRSPVWHGMESPLSRDEIAQAIKDGWTVAHPKEENIMEPHPRSYHVGRVAHLVNHGWADPIFIEPGYGWMIQDGNHRLAAAFYKRDMTIEVEFSGFLEDIEDAFGPEIAAQVGAEWDRLAEATPPSAAQAS